MTTRANKKSFLLQNQTKKKKVLIIDDDQNILSLLAMILSGEGYAVETSLTGDETDYMMDDLPDLILLDLRLEGRSGKDICIKLKGSDQTKSIPVIIISGEIDIAAVALDCGADSSIPKPFDISTFSNAVAHYTAIQHN